MTIFDDLQEVRESATLAEYGTRWGSPQRVSRRDAVADAAVSLMGGQPAMAPAVRHAFELILAEQPEGNRHAISDEQLRRLVLAIEFGSTFTVPDFVDHVVKREEQDVTPLPFGEWQTQRNAAA